MGVLVAIVAVELAGAVWLLFSLRAALNILIAKTVSKEDIVPTVDEFREQIARINTSVDNVATDIQALKDQIAGGGLTAEEEASVKAELDALESKIAGVDAGQ